MMQKNQSENYKLKNRYLLYLICILSFTFISKVNYAQQAPHYTQYLYNMEVLNPAFVGSKSDLSISLLSRQQWVGIEGAPTTTTFSIGGRTIAGFGLGATVLKDKIGLTTSTNVNIDASYTIATSTYGRISFGLKGGLTFFDNNLANGITPDNEVYASTEGNFPNIGFGGLFYNKNFFIGLSVPNLLKSNQYKTLVNVNENYGINNSNYFLTSGYIFNLSDNLKFKPSTIVKYTSSLPISVDINSNFIYDNKIEVGLSYRHENSISTLFAIIINKKYRVGYSYDYTLADYGSNLSSHEIILRFDLDLNRSTHWLFHNRCFF